jgi:hypothetical protein
MKKTSFFLCLIAAVAFAQTPEKPAEASKPAEGAKPAAEESKPAEAAADTPAAEPAITGSVEIGYRFNGSLTGNEDVYRSVVNLGEGPRLLNLDLSMSPSLKWIDELTLRANNWGDPYNHAFMRAGKAGAYRLEVDYRNIAYFNALPSFANPNIERGLLDSQRTFDMKRRYTNVELDILPGGRIIPFLGYTHDAGYGSGVTLYVPSLNEYPVPNDLRDSTDTIRGGVRLEFNRFHATVEQGGYRFKDDQRVYGPATRNAGNRTTPFFNQQLFLNSVQQAYGIRGDAWFTRVYGTANPASWIDIHGSYAHVEPDINTNYREFAQGQFGQNNPIGVFSTQQALYTAVAKQPHNRGTFSTEIRPVSRVRILQSFFADRMDTNSTLTGASTLGTQPATNLNVPDRMLIHYNQHQVEGLVEVTNALTLRGGHRYTWGQSETRLPQVSGGVGAQTSELERSTALAGVTYRVAQKLSFNVDAEIANTDKAYFRTSLMDYQRVRARVRFQPLTDWSLVWSGSFLNNDTPNTAVRPRLGDYDLVTLDNSIAFFWTPKGGNKLRAMGEYSRLSWRSNILYLTPSLLTPELSNYRENAHAANLMVDVKPSKGDGWGPRLSVGGSIFRSSGSRPTRYYQPVARLAVPVVKHIEFSGEWRWWGMSEPFYRDENFKMHQGPISLRIHQ